LPARRPRAELRLRDRRPRRRRRGRTRGVRGVAPAGPRLPARLLDVAAAHAARHGALTRRVLRKPPDVEGEHADARIAVDGMAVRADQKARAAARIGVGRAADVPSEPAFGLVAEEIAENLPAARRAELDATDLVGAAATVERGADREVVDAVAVEIAGVDDHA